MVTSSLAATQRPGHRLLVKNVPLSLEMMFLSDRVYQFGPLLRPVIKPISFPLAFLRGEMKLEPRPDCFPLGL